MPPIVSVTATTEGRSQPRLDHVGEQAPDNHDRNRAGDDQPAEPLVFTVAAGQRARRRGNQLHDVAAEENDHREQRADVARDVERDAEPAGIPAEKCARENQMARARYRQKLRQSLHHSEQRSRN
jgi:hypothetical protein